MSDEPQNEMTLEMAGRLLGIGAERIRQLSKAGYIRIHRRGHTALVPAVQGYIKYLKDEASKTTKTAAASRATDARAREIELRIAREERTLVPREDADLALDLVVGEVNKQFTGLAARITRDVPMRRKIEAEIYEAKRKIADALAHGKELAATGVDPTDPDAADAP